MTDAKNIYQSPVQQGEVMIHVENLRKSFGDNNEPQEVIWRQ